MLEDGTTSHMPWNLEKCMVPCHHFQDVDFQIPEFARQNIKFDLDKISACEVAYFLMKTKVIPINKLVADYFQEMAANMGFLN